VVYAGSVRGRRTWLSLWLLVALVAGCAKLDERLLSDDDSTRVSAIEKVKGLDDDAKASLVRDLTPKLDTGHRMSADSREDLSRALPAQANDALRAQTIRQRALAGMVATGKSAVPTLRDVVQDPKQRAWVRADAAQALGEIGPAASDATPTLEQAFDGAKDERLRVSAAGALVRFGRRDSAYVDELHRCSARCDTAAKAHARQVLAGIEN